MNYFTREQVAHQLVEDLGAQLRSAGWVHEEVVCVLLHALRLAEKRSKVTQAQSPRQNALARIEECRAELQRRPL